MKFITLQNNIWKKQGMIEGICSSKYLLILCHRSDFPDRRDNLNRMETCYFRFWQTCKADDFL